MVSNVFTPICQVHVPPDFCIRIYVSHSIHVWYIYLQQPHVGKYTIHGWYGYVRCIYSVNWIYIPPPGPPRSPPGLHLLYALVGIALPKFATGILGRSNINIGKISPNKKLRNLKTQHLVYLVPLFSTGLGYGNSLKPYMGVSLNGDTPISHPKMIIFSRKTHGCWVPPF